ncbi:MAG: hypoxanthine phosphoribosyltransferase [Thermodesulfobacteriota bacterium]
MMTESEVKRLKPLYSQREIKRVIDRIARQIETDYRNKSIVIIAVLKGSFVFTADIIRKINIPLIVDFIQVESYGQDRIPDKIRFIKDVGVHIYRRHVILVDDIVDTGHTTHFLLQHLLRRKPASLNLCALLDKPSRREVEVTIRYLGFTIPDIFVVGYGIDYAEDYRQLPGIYGIIDSKNT